MLAYISCGGLKWGSCVQWLKSPPFKSVWTITSSSLCHFSSELGGQTSKHVCAFVSTHRARCCVFLSLVVSSRILSRDLVWDQRRHMMLFCLAVYWPLVLACLQCADEQWATSLLKMLRKLDAWGAEKSVWARLLFPQTAGTARRENYCIFAQRITGPEQCKYEFSPLTHSACTYISIFSLDPPCGQSHRKLYTLPACPEQLGSYSELQIQQGASVGVSYMEML